MYEKKSQTYESDKSTKFINNVWQESANEQLRDRKMSKQYYFDSKKPCITVGRMTFERLREILRLENVNGWTYDILGKGSVDEPMQHIIAKSDNGYALYHVNNRKKELMAEYATEHDVCMAFLQVRIDNGAKRLKKYQDSESARCFFEKTARLMSCQMTFERVKEILEHEDISSDDYDILGNGHVRGYAGYVIAECPVGYALYYMERGVKDLLAEFTNEHDVCVALLQKFIRDDMKRLEKYI